MSRCFAIKTLQTESFDQSDLAALKWLSLQDQRRTYLSQTQTIDLGTLRLEDEDLHHMKRAKSDEDLFQGLKIIQKKDGWYNRSSCKRRHSSSMLKVRRYQSLEAEDINSDEEQQPKMMRLQSETDLQDIPGLRSFESGEIEIADFYMKVPVKTC